MVSDFVFIKRMRMLEHILGATVAAAHTTDLPKSAVAAQYLPNVESPQTEAHAVMSTEKFWGEAREHPSTTEKLCLTLGHELFPYCERVNQP
jgi:hypothetical protein